jgi:hypothetical protein
VTSKPYTESALSANSGEEVNSPLSGIPNSAFDPRIFPYLLNLLEYLSDRLVVVIVEAEDFRLREKPEVGGRTMRTFYWIKDN